MADSLEDIAKRFNAIPLPPRPPDVPVDKAIKAADKVDPTDPKLVERFGKPRRGTGPVIWGDQGQLVRTEEEIPE